MPSISGKKSSRSYADLFGRLGFPMQVNGSPEAIAERCPFCGKDRCYLNIETGLYHCKKCSAKGNVSDFLNWLHHCCLTATTDEQYQRLKEKRGIPLQTLKRHELAYKADSDEWLIPFKNPKGRVVNLQLYQLRTGSKFNLPGLPCSLFGLDRLGSDLSKILFLCEGPFDAIALDYHLDTKRGKYDIVATPGPFQKCWVEIFRDRKLRALFDNDAGGESNCKLVQKLLGEEGVAAEVRLLKWPSRFPKGYDINDLVREHPETSVVGLSLKQSFRVTREPKLIIQNGAAAKSLPVDWIWKNHLRCGTYASFSGPMGTLKSSIAQEIAARYSKGKPMPLTDTASMPAGSVLYVHAEDDEEAVVNGFEWAGGDLAKFYRMPARTRCGDPLNVLDHLGEIEQTIREHNVRLVVIDGQNSVVGTPRIDTDMQARSNITNKLHQFAQRLNICLMGIRNEDSTGRALGPQSMGDIGRCVWRTAETTVKDGVPFCRLVFVKVSDTARSKYPPIPYSVKDCGGSHRKILWGVSPPETAENKKQPENKANDDKKVP